MLISGGIWSDRPRKFYVFIKRGYDVRESKGTGVKKTGQSGSGWQGNGGIRYTSIPRLTKIGSYLNMYIVSSLTLTPSVVVIFLTKRSPQYP